jgi:uncharacterized membrane protein YczE
MSSQQRTCGGRYLVVTPRTARPRRFAQVCVGGFVTGVGVSLCLAAKLGVDAYSLLLDGLAQRTGWSFPVATLLVGAVLTLLWVGLLRQPAGAATLLQPVASAAGVALGTHLTLPAGAGLAFRVPVFGAGLVLVAAGIASYLAADLGPSPVDGVSVAVARRIPLNVAITSMQVLMLATGVVLGGRWGVGTFIAAAALGPTISRLLPVFQVSGGRVPASCDSEGSAASLRRRWNRTEHRVVVDAGAGG